MFVDFFNQVIEYTRDFSHHPLFKIWVGTVPFVILSHPETVEVI